MWQDDSKVCLFSFVEFGYIPTFCSSSTIITEIVGSCRSTVGIGYAYFYFTFNEPEKQKSEACISSLITQLIAFNIDLPNTLDDLYLRHAERGQQPNIADLLVVLHELVQGFDSIYLILDALDECNAQKDLLDTLKAIIGWRIDKTHVLVTSRNEPTISKTLDDIATHKICIQSHLIEPDIRAHIHERLHNDDRLASWPTHVQEKITTTLVKGSEGM